MHYTIHTLTRLGWLSSQVVLVRIKIPAVVGGGGGGGALAEEL